MADLTGAYLRLNRAQEHMPDLEGLIGAIQGTYEGGVLAYRDPETSLFEPLAGATDYFEFRASLIAGEVIYNLRAALDYLVYILAHHGAGGVYQSGTQFPIENKESGFTGRRNTFLKGVSDPHVATLSQYQPYNGCDWTRRLRDLSNFDKHRDLVSVAPTFSLTGGRAVLNVDERVQLNADGTIDYNSVEMEMYVRGTADVVFPEGVTVTDTLQQIHAEVQILLNLFNSQLGWLRP